MKGNAFQDLKTSISFNINAIEIDRVFQEIVRSFNGNEDLKPQIIKSYSILRNDILRGEEILRIFNIHYDKIQIPQEFFEELMSLDDYELINESQRIYQLINTINISRESILEFSILFTKYKYVNKAFLPKQ